MKGLYFSLNGAIFDVANPPMFVSTLVLLSIAVSLVLGDQLKFSKRSAKKCTLQLEGVVYQPETCAFKYLERISNELRLKSPLLWTPQAKSVVQTFSQTYQVQVLFIDAFDKISEYPNDPNPMYNSGTSQSILIQRLSTARGSILIAPKYYYYASIFWNTNGEMYYVIIVALRAKISSIC